MPKIWVGQTTLNGDSLCNRRKEINGRKKKRATKNGRARGRHAGWNGEKKEDGLSHSEKTCKTWGSVNLNLSEVWTAPVPPPSLIPYILLTRKLPPSIETRYVCLRWISDLRYLKRCLVPWFLSIPPPPLHPFLLCFWLFHCRPPFSLVCNDREPGTGWQSN